VSERLGVEGLHLTVARRPAVNVGLPGTGVSYRESVPAPGVHMHWFWIAVLAVAIYLLLR
jgi:hypothetical protein